MKDTTVHSLVIARTLFEQASSLCVSDDRYLTSAGLVVLQDALEIVFYALLIELGVDEEKKNLEQLSFDELIGELKRKSIVVPKSGTLKALNKQRVLTKHYAQVAEPVTVRNFLGAAQQALETTVHAVTGRVLTDIYLSDLLQTGEAKLFLKTAEQYISESRFRDALIEIRKAFFIEFEDAYSVYNFRDYEEGKSRTLFMLKEGKAPYWTMNKKWIRENVFEPLDYIQIDSNRWLLDALEWGINTTELQNVQRLTPQVFRSSFDSDWCIKYDVVFPANDATFENAKYCLDRTIVVILKKQEHQRTSRYRAWAQRFVTPPLYGGDNLYSTASTTSDVVHVVSESFEYRFGEVVSGFNPTETFFSIIGVSKELNDNGLREEFRGFLLIRESNSD